MRTEKSANWLTMFVLTLPLLGLIGYFVHAAIWSDTGYFALQERRQSITALTSELETATDEVARLADRTRRLSADSVDLDLLDERLRATLGYARPDEEVLFLTEPAN